jgi:hypothetical protein
MGVENIGEKNQLSAWGEANIRIQIQFILIVTFVTAFFVTLVTGR